MSHLRAFVANRVLLQISAFWGLFCSDFYSDIEDFTQILCRYLPKKLAAKTSGISVGLKTSQELRMLSSVTLNCQVTNIVMDSVSQL